jgi:hypothetical protein
MQRFRHDCPPQKVIVRSHEHVCTMFVYFVEQRTRCVAIDKVCRNRQCRQRHTVSLPEHLSTATHKCVVIENVLQSTKCVVIEQCVSLSTMLNYRQPFPKLGGVS